MANRSFSSPTDAAPVFFELNGERYDCIPQLPAGFGLDILSQGSRKAAEFFDVILVDSDVERFAAAIRDKEKPVPQETFDQIVEWLVEVYTGRPTGQFNASANGAPPTGLPLTPPASGRA